MAKAPTPTHDSIAWALSDWSDRCDARFTTVQELPGSGNRSFHLSATDPARVDHAQTKDFVLRINGDAEHLGVDREREQTILKLLAPYDFHARLLHTDKVYWVFEYLEASATPSATGIGQTLRQLHQLKDPWIKQQPRWTPVDTINDYLQLLPEAKTYLASKLQDLQSIAWQKSDYALCHIDLNPGNIIQTASGTRFIDWEYARVGPVIYDFAVLLETYPTLDQTLLLDAYGATFERDLLDAARLAYTIIEALWLAITDPDTHGKSLYRKFS